MRLPIVGRIATLALVLLVVPLATDAQRLTKVFRIGVLNAGSPPSEPGPDSEAFRQGLRDLGYVEGQNLIIERRYAERSDERARDLAAELGWLQVDVIVALGGPAARGPSRQPVPSPSSWLLVMHWNRALSPAWHGRAGISRGSASWPRN